VLSNLGHSGWTCLIDHSTRHRLLHWQGLEYEVVEDDEELSHDEEGDDSNVSTLHTFLPTHSELHPQESDGSDVPPCLGRPNKARGGKNGSNEECEQQ
jgi:hypothetical protein